MCVSVWVFSETAFDIDHSHAEPCALRVTEPWVIRHKSRDFTEHRSTLTIQRSSKRGKLPCLKALLQMEDNAFLSCHPEKVFTHTIQLSVRHFWYPAMLMYLAGTLNSLSFCSEGRGEDSQRDHSAHQARNTCSPALSS